MQTTSSTVHAEPGRPHNERFYCFRCSRHSSFCSFLGWEVSRLLAQSSGTVCQPLCELQLSPLWRSLDIWRPTCLADRQHVWGLFMTRSTNPLIIIIIIIIIIIPGVAYSAPPGSLDGGEGSLPLPKNLTPSLPGSADDICVAVYLQCYTISKKDIFTFS